MHIATKDGLGARAVKTWTVMINNNDKKRKKIIILMNPLALGKKVQHEKTT